MTDDRAMTSEQERHVRLARDPSWSCDGQAMQRAVEDGDEAFVRWHLMHCVVNDVQALMTLAASHGHVTMLELLWSSMAQGEVQGMQSVIVSAVEGGHLDALQWLHANVEDGWSSQVVDEAAECGHLDIVKWLHETQSDLFVASTMGRAAMNGHLSVVQWLHATRSDGCSTDAMDWAAMHGHLDTVRWLHANRSEGCSTWAMDGAARNGHLLVVQWLHSHRPEGCTTLAMDLAAKKGHLDVVQWLHEARSEGCTIAAMDGAASNGHLRVVEWLARHRSEGCSTDAMDSAAENGHLDVVKRLHEHQLESCTMDAMDWAAANGHLAIVRWLHANRTEGCTKDAMTSAAINGHLDVVKWLYTNRTEGCRESVMDEAAANGQLAVVQWLHVNQLGCCTVAAMDHAAKNGHLSVLDWLHANRTEGCTRDAVDWAALNGHLSIVQWLARNRPEAITPRALRNAAENHHWRVLEWLIRNQTEKCSVRLFPVVLERCQLNIVQALYGRDELLSWPRPVHASILTKLVRSGIPCQVAKWKYIVRVRQQRYLPDAADNLHLGETDDSATVKLRSHTTSESFVLTAVWRVCDARLLPPETNILISQFIMKDPIQRCNPMEAAERGWVYWLRRFSSQPCADMIALARHDYLDEARRMHEHLRTVGRPQCAKHFLYLSMEKGDLEYVQWHICNCDVHTLAEWVYLTTWIGRVDVADWICENWSEISHRHLNARDDDRQAKRATLFHDLTASFTTVAARFESDLMEIEASMDEGERAARSGAKYHLFTLRGSSTELDLAAVNGHSDIVESLYRRHNANATVSGLYGAISRGHLQVVRLIYRHQPELVHWPRQEDGAEVLRALWSPVNKHTLAYLRRKRSMRLEASDLNDAAFHGDLTRVQVVCELDLVDWTHVSTYPVDIAAVQGHYEIVKLFYSRRGNRGSSTRAMDGAAEGGYLRIVQYLHDHGQHGSSTMMQLTLTARSGYGCRWDDINQTAGHEANRGYISGVVKAIVVDGRREFATEREVAKMEKAGDEKTTVVDASEKRGADVLGRDDVATDTTSEGEYESAVSGADVTEVRLIGTECACQAARWAHKWLVKDTEWWCEGDAMKEAVEDGDEVFVKWHLENCKTNDSRWLMPLAASFGHVGILVLLLERGLSFNAKVVMESIGAAAEHGQVPVLRWFHENIMGRWSSDVMDKAAMHGHLDAVRWLHENRREGCTTNAIYEAAMGGHFEVVKWLHHNRPDDCKETAMTGAAQNGHLDIVKWLHENRTEGCTTNAMDGAAKNGHLEVVQWLHKNRKEGCTTYAMDAAAGYGHLNVVQWLHNHRSEGCSIEGMRLATVNGHKDIVKWLQEHRDECRTKAPDLVIQTPIKAQEGRPMPQSIDDAADSGHWHMVEQLLRSPSAVYGDDNDSHAYFLDRLKDWHTSSSDLLTTSTSNADGVEEEFEIHFSNCYEVLAIPDDFFPEVDTVDPDEETKTSSPSEAERKQLFDEAFAHNLKMDISFFLMELEELSDAVYKVYCDVKHEKRTLIEASTVVKVAIQCATSAAARFQLRYPSVQNAKDMILLMGD
ncbi:hypothetical protein Poli38472_007102 [Pythium oligandrum]|uniref:DUF6604 domain-containing protein n=1 Tax=Pythium oligandrum TaxID=41045 RepID=A0A8K1C9C1_PYTOL|nr:hypothetical protein Poli38472_007102 [Pythium oligandrum]|eukprot:TMW58957.1 hypothetical protein Poli38472_007102 [Pythium oligandrum]